MKWLLDENGNIVMRNGKPVAIDSNGKEFEYDVNDRNERMVATVAEATKHRKEKAELKKTLDTIPKEIQEAPQSYVDAFTTVGSLDDKNKADIEKLKGELQASFDASSKISTDRITSLEGQLYQEKVTTKFATTDALKDTIFNDTREIAESYFGKHFKVDENGSMVGTLEDGSTIYSKEKPGVAAGFDECVSTLINSHPKKDSFLSATNQRGTGNPPSDGIPSNDQGALGNIEAGLAARKG